jgi:hypothetical protein
MSLVMDTDSTQDGIAVSLARAVTIANRTAREAGVEPDDRMIFISQDILDDVPIWRITYGHKDYINRRGGGYIVNVNAQDGSVVSVQRSQ